MSEIREKLEALRRKHYECDDSWYSCPLSEEGTSNCDVDKDKCNCGAETYNAILDEALALLPPEGETRGTIHDATEQIRIEALVRDSHGDYRINLTKVEEILHRYFPEPAPSSEKALKAQAVLMARYFRDVASPVPYLDAWHTAGDVLASSPDVTQDKSAPEATKEERKPNLRDYDFEDLADYNPD